MGSAGRGWEGRPADAAVGGGGDNGGVVFGTSAGHPSVGRVDKEGGGETRRGSQTSPRRDPSQGRRRTASNRPERPWTARNRVAKWLQWPRSEPPLPGWSEQNPSSKVVGEGG